MVLAAGAAQHADEDGQLHDRGGVGSGECFTRLEFLAQQRLAGMRPELTHVCRVMDDEGVSDAQVTRDAPVSHVLQSVRERELPRRGADRRPPLGCRQPASLHWCCLRPRFCVRFRPR